jgi:hypothetical protein
MQIAHYIQSIAALQSEPHAPQSDNTLAVMHLKRNDMNRRNSPHRYVQKQNKNSKEHASIIFPRKIKNLFERLFFLRDSLSYQMIFDYRNVRSCCQELQIIILFDFNMTYSLK